MNGGDGKFVRSLDRARLDKDLCNMIKINICNLIK